MSAWDGDTEADHLSEIGYEPELDPDIEQEYRRAVQDMSWIDECRTRKPKRHRQKHAQAAHGYALAQKGRYGNGRGERMYLVDRRKTRSCWWSFSPGLAMVFHSRSAAETQAGRYRHNNVQVVEI